MVLALAGCLEIPALDLDNPCDPANGGCRDAGPDARADVAHAPPVPDGTVVARDAALPDAATPRDALPPDGGTGPCAPSNFSNVQDCPVRIAGFCAYEFEVDPNVLTCEAFCPQIGQRCARAWLPDDRLYCEPASEGACRTRARGMICGCYTPQ